MDVNTGGVDSGRKRPGNRSTDIDPAKNYGSHEREPERERWSWRAELRAWYTWPGLILVFGVPLFLIIKGAVT